MRVVSQPVRKKDALELVTGQPVYTQDIAPPDWEEKTFNYNRRQGISLAKMMGWLTPEFYTGVSDSVETFGVMAVDHALQ